jgi:hypothetical protein
MTDWLPMQPLLRSNADVSLVSLISSAVYTEPVEDPWFQATNISSYQNASAYSANSYMTFLAAASQYQFCSSPDFTTSCGPLRGLEQSPPTLFNGSSNPDFAGFTPFQKATAQRIYRAVESNSGLSPDSSVLDATNYLWNPGVGVAMSSPLSPTQWKTEAFNLHNLTLAGLQRFLVSYPAPPVFDVRPGVSSAQFLQLATEPADLQLCAAQKVHNTAYTSFSVVGLGLVFGFGGVIIIANLVVADAVFAVRRYLKLPEGKSLDWVNGDFLLLEQERTVVCEEKVVFEEKGESSESKA